MNFERLTSSRSDLMLWSGIAGAIAAAVILIALVIPPDPNKLEPLSHFSIPMRLSPDWGAGPGGGSEGPSILAETASDPSPDTHGAVVYLDTSHSMGGYLPPDGMADSSIFRTVAQLIPGHLVGSFGGGVTWRTVDQALTAMGSAPGFRRGLFQGSSTRLELAIGEIMNDLHENRIRGAVLLTDLVATGNADGAMGVAQAILPWLRSTAVREGHFDVGILGVRGEYWGMQARQCASNGKLGCWYSEHAKRYLPLTEQVQRPFFVLVFGSSDAEKPVDRMGRALEASLRDLGFDPRWELLTENTRNVDGWLLCSAARETEQGDRPQYALYRQDDGRFECRRDEIVTLTCCGTIEGRPSKDDSCLGREAVRLARRADSTWSAVQLQNRGSSLGIHLDCAALRNEKPSEDLDLSGLVVAETAAPSPASWDGWSVDTDETQESLSGVLQMDLFLDTVRLRPERYQLTAAEPLLRVDGP